MILFQNEPKSQELAEHFSCSRCRVRRNFIQKNHGESFKFGENDFYHYKMNGSRTKSCIPVRTIRLNFRWWTKKQRFGGTILSCIPPPPPPPPRSQLDPLFDARQRKYITGTIWSPRLDTTETIKYYKFYNNMYIRINVLLKINSMCRHAINVHLSPSVILTLLYIKLLLLNNVLIFRFNRDVYLGGGG